MRREQTMEIDDAPEEPAPPLGPGPKLGTVVAMVDFRPPAETGQQTYYQDHNARLEAQRRKADATERRVLESFYGVPASAWAEAAALPLVRGSAEQRMGHSQVSEWKKTLRVGDTIDVLHQGFWHEAVVRSVPAQTSSPYSSYSYASWSVGLTAFDGQLISCGRYDRPMAPRGMFVGDWRASLAVGDRVEARLDDNTWAMARVTAAADADEEEAKPKPAPARGGGVDICLVVIAGERFESSLEAGGVVNKGAEYRTLVRDTETFGSLRRTWAQQHGLQESELTLWSRPDPAPAPAPAPASSSPLGKLGSWVGGKLNAMTAPAPAPAAATQVPGPRGPDVRVDLESCARDLNLAGTATIVVTKNLDVVTTEATGLLELTVIGGDETKLELPRSSPRLTRAGTHCKNQGLTKLKALELMGPSLCGINQCVDGVEDDAMTARTRRKILISTQVRRKMCSGACSTSTCPRKIRAGATLVRSGRSCASARRRRTRIESLRSSPRSLVMATSRCHRCRTSSRRR